MRTVVLLSGGIDSTVLLASLRRAGDDCLAVSFNYRQAHSRELSAACHIADYYNVRHQIVNLPVLRGDAVAEGNAVVPGRNLVMLSTAAAIADSWGATAVAFGANKDDINGFTDCRPEFIAALDEAVYRSGITCKSVLAPLVHFTKAEVIQLGKQLKAPLHLTWSCYRGGEQPCGQCGACELRKQAMA